MPRSAYANESGERERERKRERLGLGGRRRGFQPVGTRAAGIETRGETHKQKWGIKKNKKNTSPNKKM
jgi:hypothetical protein